jgi:hypothetical protein
MTTGEFRSAGEIPSSMGTPKPSARINIANLAIMRIASAQGNDRELVRWLPSSGPKRWWYRDLETARISGGGVVNPQWAAVFQQPYAEAGLAEPKVTWKTSQLTGEDYLGFDCAVNASVRDLGRISVIMTTHNPGAWLHEAVESVAHQTVKIHEIILIDDFSDDRHRSFIDGIAAMHPNLRLIRLSSNVGTYRSRVEGIRNATGDYLVFHDSDDWSHPERIEKQIEAMERFGHKSSIPVCARFDKTMKVALWRQLFPGNENGPGLIATRDSFTTEILSLFDEGRTGVDGRILFQLNKQKPGTLKLRMDSPTGPVPLLIQQAHRGSLSGADYLLSWENPSRRRYKDSYHAGGSEGDASFPSTTDGLTLCVGGFTKHEQEKSAKLALKVMTSLNRDAESVMVYWPNPVRRQGKDLGKWTTRLRADENVREITEISSNSRLIYCGVGSILLSEPGELECIGANPRKFLAHGSISSKKRRTRTLALVSRNFGYKFDDVTYWKLRGAIRDLNTPATTLGVSGQDD